VKLLDFNKKKVRKQKLDDEILPEDDLLDDDTLLPDDDSLSDDPIDSDLNDQNLFNDGFNDNFNDFNSGFSTQPPMERQYPDLLKGLTDFSAYLRSLYNNWTGLTWNEEAKEFMQNPNIEPIMNIKGANWFVGFIETYVRKNNSLSWLNTDEYYAIFDDINRTLFLTVGSRYDEFGFKCNSDVIRVWNEVENASLLAISAAGSGKMMNFLGGREGGIMNYNSTDHPMLSNQGYGQQFGQQPQRKQGWFSNKAKKFSNWAVGVQERI